MTQPSSTSGLLRALLAPAWGAGALGLPDPLPWQEIAEVAHQGGVAPLLYQALASAPPPVPPPVLDDLRAAYYACAAHNVRCMADLDRVLAALPAISVPVLVLKGPALVERLYPNLATRAIGDLDLLVAREHVPRCRRALLDLGYVPTEVEERPGAHLRYRGHEAFANPEVGRAPVEIHWHPLDQPYYMRKVPCGWFWEHSQAEQFSGQPVRVLTDQANLVYLPAHLALHHRFHGLRWWVDLAFLVQRCHETIDLDALIATARETELLLTLQHTYETLREFWPALPLDALLERLRPHRPAAMEARVYHLLTAEPRSRSLDFYSDLVSLPDLGERVRFLFRNLVPQPDYMVKRYQITQRWKLPWYYLLRVVDGAWKAAHTLPEAFHIERAPP